MRSMLNLLVISLLLSVVHGHMCNSNTGCGCNQNANCLANGCGCGFSQNQNSYGGSRNTFGQPVSAACQGPLPCYNIVMSLIADGPTTFDALDNEQEFLQATSRAGLMRREVIAEGRKVAAHYRDTFGVDFTSMSDSEFLSGRRMNAEGVEFRNFRLNPLARYRVYMASTNGGAQLFNRPIHGQGWILNFTRPMWGTGTFRKLIPAGALLGSGIYIFHPCGMPRMEDNIQPCNNILNPQDPWAPIVISYISPNYQITNLEPYPHFAANFILTHKVWGEGRAQAMVTIRDLDEQIADIRMTFTFPSYR